MADMWPTIQAERIALSNDLGDLGADEWDRGSLCPDWTVGDVVAHMTATARITPASFFPRLIGSGFSLRHLQAKDIVAQRRELTGRHAGSLPGRDRLALRPPGPKDTMLGETIIHSEDVRRGLGVANEYPMDAVVELADFYKGSNLILGTKRRIAGLGLSATDTTWSPGSGPRVTGRMLDLLMSMVGRRPVYDVLEGDGVEVLRSR